jgi:hypothetical protein
MMVLTRIRGLERKFDLKGIFVVYIENADGTFVVSHASLPVTGYGATQLQAVEEFQEMFEAQWLALVDSSDELTAGARRARDAFLALATVVAAD